MFEQLLETSDNNLIVGRYELTSHGHYLSKRHQLWINSVIDKEKDTETIVLLVEPHVDSNEFKSLLGVLGNTKGVKVLSGAVQLIGQQKVPYVLFEEEPDLENLREAEDVWVTGKTKENKDIVIGHVPPENKWKKVVSGIVIAMLTIIAIVSLLPPQPPSLATTIPTETLVMPSEAATELAPTVASTILAPLAISSTNVAQVVELHRFEDLIPWVGDVTFSPDSRLLAAAIADGTIRVWDTQTWEQIKEYRGFEDAANTVDFSPDGTLLAAGGQNGRVLMWDVQSGEQVAEFTGHSEAVYVVNFSPKGEWLASGGEDKTVIIWDVATHATLFAFSTHTAAVHSIAMMYLGDSSTAPLYTITTSYNEQDYRMLRKELIGLPDNVETKKIKDGLYAVDFEVLPISPFTNVTVLNNGTVLIQKEVSTQTFIMNDGGAGSVAISPDGSLFAWGGTGKNPKVIIASIDDGAFQAIFTSHASSVEAIGWSPDGTMIATCGDDGRVIILGLRK